MRFLILSLMLLFAVPAFAADCYDAEQAQAEAAIRIHSEIMVTALTCQYDSQAHSLTDMYVAFGKMHNERLRRAEQTVINYYQKKNGAGVARLDKLRTALGNEYAERIAKYDPTTYCGKMADNVTAAGSWTPAQFEEAIVRAAASSSATDPLCAKMAAVH